MAWVFEQESETKMGDRLVLLVIANHADRNGENSWPSVRSIAGEANLTPRGAQKAIERLVRAGLVAVEYQRGGKMDQREDRRPNRYRIIPMSSPSRGEPGFTPSNVDKPVNRKSRGEHGDIHGVNMATSRGEPGFTHPILEPSFEPSLKSGARAPVPVDKSKRKSGLAKEICAAADPIYRSDPERFTDLVKWLRQKIAEKWPAPAIVAALEEFRGRMGEIEGEWWPYLDAIGKRRRTEHLQAEASGHKGPIQGELGQVLRGLVKSV